MHIYDSLSLRTVEGKWLTGEGCGVVEGSKVAGVAAGGSVSPRIGGVL